MTKFTFTKRSLSVLLLVALLAISTTAWAIMPASFDLRDVDGRSYIGPVRDQGSCGGCYAFGALASAESTWNRTYGLYDDNALDLSESFIVWSLSPLYDGLQDCDGADLDRNELTALLEYGAPLETDFPFTPVDPGADLHWDAERYQFADWYRIPANDIETTKRVIHSIGAVDATVWVDDPFGFYPGGIFENTSRGFNHSIPYYTGVNHSISLVGWNDDSGDGGMGHWFLRNSWGESWGEGGYMNLRYTSAYSNLAGTYLIAEPWSGPNVNKTNASLVEASSWDAGGTRNAHAVDLWGGAASSVDNRGTLRAVAAGGDELTTARGVYLWGGPEGQVVNSGQIEAQASSATNQAAAYGVCAQGQQVTNSGTIEAAADTVLQQASSYGVWLANGSQNIGLTNSGSISAVSTGLNAMAYGVLADSRAVADVVNTGDISATSDLFATGVFLSGTGTGLLRNSGTITGIAPIGYSVISNIPTHMILEGNSDLVGPALLAGDDDLLELQGRGSEDALFYQVETLYMNGDNWSLSSDSDFDLLYVKKGRLRLNGDIGGLGVVASGGALGGAGSLVGSLFNYGTVAPGNSIDTLTIADNYYQATSGTLEIEVGASSADRLLIGGTATLQGRLLVVPHGYTLGGTYTFLESGVTEGAFTDLISAAVLDVDLNLDDPTQMVLSASRNSYSSLAASHNASLATVLDGVRATASGDQAALLDALDLSLSTAALNGSLAALTPRVYATGSVIALNAAQARLGDLQRQTQKIFKMQGPKGTYSPWLEAYGRREAYGRDGFYPEVDERQSGVMGGVHYHTAQPGLTLGLAAAYSESDFSFEHSSDEGELEVFSSFLYGGWQGFGVWDGFYLDAAIGSGYNDWTGERHISFANLKNSADYTGVFFNGYVRAGYDWQRGDWLLGATAGLSWVNLEEDSFREKGAAASRLEVKERDSESWQSRLGISAGQKFIVKQVPIQTTGRLDWIHEFEDEAADSKALMADVPTAFSIKGRELVKNKVVLGASIDGQITDSMSISLDYDCTFHDGFEENNHAVKLSAGMAF